MSRWLGCLDSGEPDYEAVYRGWERTITEPQPIPEGSMRVAPGSDAVVWRVNADHCGEL